MAGSALPVNIDATYADDETDASVKEHQQAHDLVHNIVNLFEKDTVFQDGMLWRYDLATNLFAPVHPATKRDFPVDNTTHNLERSDNGKVLEFTGDGANSVVVPISTTLDLPIGFEVAIYQHIATATVTISPESTVTIGSYPATEGARNLDGQYAQATLRKRAPNHWLLVGQLA